LGVVSLLGATLVVGPHLQGHGLDVLSFELILLIGNDGLLGLFDLDLCSSVGLGFLLLLVSLLHLLHKAVDDLTLAQRCLGVRRLRKFEISLEIDW
jgi:hypothetical protein